MVADAARRFNEAEAVMLRRRRRNIEDWMDFEQLQ